MKKAIKLMLATSLMLTACSEKETIYVVNKDSEVKSPSPSQVLNGSGAVNAWSLDYLFSGATTNLALAEILVPEFIKMQRMTAMGKDSLAWKASEADLQNVLASSHQKILSDKIKLFQDKYYWKQTLVENLQVSKAAGVFNEKVKLEKLTKANNESLQRIFDIFNKELTRNSRAIARDIVSDPRNAKLVAHIDAVVSKDTQIKAAEILKLLKKMDARLATYNLPDDENVKLLIYSAVAVQMVQVLKDNTSVKALLNAAMEVGKVAAKAREVILMTQALDQYRLSIKEDWSAIGSSFSGMMQGLKQFEFDVEQVKLSAEARKGLTKAVGDALMGKQIPEGQEGTSYLSASYQLPENLNTFVQKTASAAGTLDKMLTITDRLATTLGVELSPDVRKVMDGARKVNEVIQVGHAVMGAFASQGMVGALGILAGGGGAGILATALMPDPGMEKILGELREIKQDIKDIKQDVAIILEQQRSSLQILKEIAVMIDRNHKQVLRELEGLRAEVLENRKLLGTAAFMNLSHCSLSMLSSNLDADLSIDSYKAAKSLLKGTELIYLNSSYRNACATAMSQAFSIQAGDLTKSTYHVVGDDQDALFKEKALYASALKYLSKTSQGADWQMMALHIPMATYRSVSEVKIRYLNLNRNAQNNRIRDLDGLISPEVLEMYVVALLHSHALLGMSDNFLGQTDQQMLKESIEGSTSLSRNLLEKALNKVNISIAQQAMLSGEPLLPVLNRDLQSILTDKTDCSVDATQGYCFVRMNVMMMGNLLRYRGGFPDEFTKDRVVKKDGKEFLRIGPASEEVQLIDIALLRGDKDRVSYDSSMPRLLELQALLTAELTKVSPLNLAENLKNALKVGYEK